MQEKLKDIGFAEALLSIKNKDLLRVEGLYFGTSKSSEKREALMLPNSNALLSLKCKGSQKTEALIAYESPGSGSPKSKDSDTVKRKSFLKKHT